VPVEALPRAKLGWTGAVKALAADGALGTNKRWSAILDLTASVTDLDRYDAALRKHTFAATMGKARRPTAAPAECPVHAYNNKMSTLRSTVATFGKAPLPEPPKTAAPSVHSYTEPRSTLRKSTAATFGKAPIEAPPRTAGPDVHSYAAPFSSFTPKLGATFGRATTGRGEALKTACSVHSYSATMTTPSTARRSAAQAVSTFGTAPARPQSFTAMTKTGLLLATPKRPTTLPPLAPAQRTAAAAHAITFASKLRKTVSAVEVMTLEETPKGTCSPARVGTPAEMTKAASTPGAATPIWDADATPTFGSPVCDFKPEVLGLLMQEKLKPDEGYHSPAKRKLSMNASVAAA